MSDQLGLRVVIVEDEALIALHLQDMLEDMGCTTAAVFSSVPDALKEVGEVAADAAILDVNVAGKEVFPVAEILAERKVPIVFSTGYGAGMLPERWRNNQIVSKPFNPGALRERLIAAAKS
jgi:DNA-binding response OmpR family regulator